MNLLFGFTKAMENNGFGSLSSSTDISSKKYFLNTFWNESTFVYLMRLIFGRINFLWLIHGNLSSGNLSYSSILKNKSTESFSLTGYLMWFQILSLIALRCSTLNRKKWRIAFSNLFFVIVVVMVLYLPTIVASDVSNPVLTNMKIRLYEIIKFHHLRNYIFLKMISLRYSVNFLRCIYFYFYGHHKKCFNFSRVSYHV